MENFAFHKELAGSILLQSGIFWKFFPFLYSRAKAWTRGGAKIPGLDFSGDRNDILAVVIRSARRRPDATELPERQDKFPSPGRQLEQ